MTEFGAVRFREIDSLSGSPSFDEFYRERRTEMARAVILAVADRELGTEATDEAFTRALESWAAVEAYENPEGWVYRVALNWARSRLRRRHRHLGAFLDDGRHFDGLPEPELLEAVERLPYAYRSVVVARFFLDWSIEQTAEALNMPEGTVKTRQARALRRLRRALGVQDES